MKYNILDKLIHSAVSGTLQAGEALPSENQLAQRYSIPRIHVREALKTLEEMGYISSKQGKGWYFRERQKKIPLNLDGTVSFTEKMVSAGLELETLVMFVGQIPWNPKIGAMINTESDESIYQIDRLRTFSGIPAALHTSYLRKTDFPGIEQDGYEIGSLFAFFKEQGYTNFFSSRSLLSIHLPTARERELLACPPLVPLLLVESDTIDQNSGKILQYTKILYRSDTFQYVI